MEICSMIQGTQTWTTYQPRRVGWGGIQEGVSRGGGYVYIPITD